MQPLAPNGESFARQNPNAILEECRSISGMIGIIEEYFTEVNGLQQRYKSAADSADRKIISDRLTTLNTKIMDDFLSAANRLKSVKQQPESGNARNASQVRFLQDRLKRARFAHQKIEAEYQKTVREDFKRQYKTVRPDASPAEIEEAMEDTSNQQVFSQALMQSTRSGEARAAANAVESRHKEIQKIESQMIELAQLFQEMEALVVQQEAAVTVIEQKGEEVVENLDKGNEQLDSGIKSARARNRKKWWCLLICSMLICLALNIRSLLLMNVVIIIIIIVVVVIIYVKVINPPKAAKRSVIYALEARYLNTDQPWTPRGRLALRDTPWTA
jgi:syntaxin 1B/2/3